MRFFIFASLSLLPVFGAAGCAVDEAAAPDDLGSDESELRAACALGNGCPEALKVLSSTTLQSVPRVEARDDVTVDYDRNPEWIAEPFAQTTSRKLVHEGRGRVVLTGSADGTAPLVIDDFLLVEVLAESGQVLSRGVVNPAAGLLVDGATPAVLASGATWGGPGKGWAYAQVDVTSLLPADRKPFRLRVSAFDVISFATTSDVFVKVVPNAPPPPPPPPPAADPFDPSSCNVPALSRADALTTFAPATSKVTLPSDLALLGRTRDCHPVTGCAAWRAISSIDLALTNAGWFRARLPLPSVTTVTLSVSTGGVVKPSFTTESKAWLHTIDVHQQARSAMGVSGCNAVGGKTSCSAFWLRDGANQAREARDFGDFTGVVGKSCVFLKSTAKTTTSETELVIQGRLKP